jgi:IS605 OrfB family transposase
VSNLTRTYQTRFSSDFDTPLSAYADLMAHVEHCLFSDFQRGQEPGSLKSAYMTRFQITARQFNSIRVSLEGKIDSIRQQIARRIQEKELQIKSIEDFLLRPHSKKLLHQKKRRFSQLSDQLKKLKIMLEDKHTPLCFGSRKLFHQQFNLTENGYRSHEEWRAEWKKSRCSEIFLLGSKDESGGNQSCTASLNFDGSVTLRLRLPDALLARFGKYLIIPHIRFAYGHEHIASAIQNCELRRELFLAKDPSYSHHGQSITFRLKKDDKGWRLFASTDIAPISLVTSKDRGVVAIDINSDHLAVVETDRFGNPLQSFTVPLVLKDLSSHQVRARIGDAAAFLIDFCRKTQKPLIIEHLDFQKKRSQLREQGASYSRMLSAFAYRSIQTHLKARGAAKGIEVYSVNPAYTSIIGRVKFADRYGLSIHHAAALSIGRRFLGVSERMPQGQREIPDGKGGHVTLDLPVRNRSRHVWSQWGQLKKKLSAALTAHFRAGTSRSSSSCKTARETEIPGSCRRNSGTRIVSTTALLTYPGLYEMHRFA